MPETALSVKGQIVIPLKVREKLGLRTGQRFELVNGGDEQYDEKWRNVTETEAKEPSDHAGVQKAGEHAGCLARELASWTGVDEAP